jgi:branched-chain amino acid aminotransferase
MPEPAVWYDGRIVLGATPQPTLRTFGLHYGYAAFEGLRSFAVDAAPAVFALQPHIDRLLESARVLDIPVRYDNAQLVDAHYQVLDANGLTNAYLRPIAFLGDGLGGLDTRQHVAHLAVLAWPWANPVPAGGGVRLAVATRRRPSPDCFPPHVKAAGSYLVAKLAYNEAVRRGFADAIMLDDRGVVAEASTMNLFCIRDGALLTPTTRACLPGITRQTVMTLARAQGLTVRETDLTVTRLLAADEVFLTSTAAGVRPVLEIEDQVIGAGRPGPVTTDLRRLYDQYVLAESASRAVPPRPTAVSARGASS